MELVVPSTPKFMPFKDEEVSATLCLLITVSLNMSVSSVQAPASPGSHNATAPGTVMKEKVAASGSVGGMSSEAEALRKDPLKNYDVDERVVAFD